MAKGHLLGMQNIPGSVPTTSQSPRPSASAVQILVDQGWIPYRAAFLCYSESHEAPVLCFGVALPKNPTRGNKETVPAFTPCCQVCLEIVYLLASFIYASEDPKWLPEAPLLSSQQHGRWVGVSRPLSKHPGQKADSNPGPPDAVSPAPRWPAAEGSRLEFSGGLDEVHCGTVLCSISGAAHEG